MSSETDIRLTALAAAMALIATGAAVMVFAGDFSSAGTDEPLQDSLGYYTPEYEVKDQDILAANLEQISLGQQSFSIFDHISTGQQGLPVLECTLGGHLSYSGIHINLDVNRTVHNDDDALL